MRVKWLKRDGRDKHLVRGTLDPHKSSPGQLHIPRQAREAQIENPLAWHVSPQQEAQLGLPNRPANYPNLEQGHDAASPANW